MKALAAVLALALALAAPAGAAVPRIGGQYRYWAFSNANDLRDVLVYWVPGPFHVQLEAWDFVKGTDQFRPEVGLHLRDFRRSTYNLQYRHEWRQERFWVGTDQVLGEGFVGRVETSPIVGRDSTSWVHSAGLDRYFGSWSFASATVIRDPREGGLWVVPVRLRLANERDDWLQLTLAPASQRTLGWAVDTRLRGVRLGVERNSRYDFTRLDNTIYTVGYEHDFGRSE